MPKTDKSTPAKQAAKMRRRAKEKEKYAERVAHFTDLAQNDPQKLLTKGTENLIKSQRDYNLARAAISKLNNPELLNQLIERFPDREEDRKIAKGSSCDPSSSQKRAAEKKEEEENDRNKGLEDALKGINPRRKRRRLAPETLPSENPKPAASSEVRKPQVPRGQLGLLADAVTSNAEPVAPALPKRGNKHNTL